MRLSALRCVASEDGDELGTESSVRTKRTRHDAEDSTVRERYVRAEELLRFTARERDHRIAHDGDAALVREATGNFVAVDEADGLGWCDGHRQLCYRSMMASARRTLC